MGLTEECLDNVEKQDTMLRGDRVSVVSRAGRCQRGVASEARQGEHQEYIDLFSLHRQVPTE